jgi:ribose-phosphate pyrophosphokinase
MLVLGFEDYRPQGERLAKALECPFATARVHRFPDGESKLTLPPGLPETLIICRSLNQPNDKLVELLLAAETARDGGVQLIILVAPYLCYMRQDIAFQPGEAVSQRIIGRFLAGLCDAVITVDPHLHRIEQLTQAIPIEHAIALSATAAMAGFLQAQCDLARALLLGPDDESRQWAQRIAVPTGLDYQVASKQRLGDRHVQISLPGDDYTGRDIILVDDMISTGRTLITVAQELKRHGAAHIDCLATHALFPDAVLRQLHSAGIRHIWSSDSVSHKSNALHLDTLLAAAVRDLQRH